ncbi:MAG: cysteine--tRNA ligase [Ruminococcus sp.]|nr:cysteine--tRNA ligase [Ruminococcus sp.]
MKAYNTLSRKLEDFTPLNGKKVNMYVCGPTVYNLIHLGNARPLCVFDCIRRYLIHAGYDVNYITNFTDVDDKIIRKANEENVKASEISEKYIVEFFKDSDGLGVMRSSVYPKVTENMDAIIALVAKLVDKGFAYENEGDVYFSALKFDGYGKLSHMPIDDLSSGARVDVSEKKREPLDFALWKAAKPGEPSWDSPWGKGRPGWHIECSTMSEKYAGDTLDIHGGGQDLMFPHHENEVAQSEAATGKPLAKYWLHNGFLNIDNTKMSKSLGNFFTVRDVAEKYGYDAIRFFLISAHYRNPVNYTDKLIESAKASLERMKTCREALEMAVANAASSSEKISEEVENFTAKAKQDFDSAMAFDFNTADAIASIFELVTSVNILLTKQTANKNELLKCAAVFDELTGILGLDLRDNGSEKIPKEVTDLAEARTAAKKEKNFSLADELREKIKILGYNIEDTRQGVKITKI